MPSASKQPSNRLRSRDGRGLDKLAISGNPLCAFTSCFVEPMTGIEPAYSAWEADVLPLNYIGAVARKG